MNYEGIIIGAMAFLIIGIFHPIVIKAEYYYSKKCWPAFLVFGIGLIGWASQVNTLLLSAGLGIMGFSSLWSIHELIEQENRVRKGWFPKNPKREYNF
ncbi:MAG: DUF4491 family protein [Candidatus Marinimicrobia bacterium]|nr:DUF4491 family protein [Candidatus Neomarinimicrobiota bacterium]